MNLQQVITKLDQGYFEVLEDVSDRVFLKLIRDLAKAKSNPQSTIDEYSSSLGVDLNDNELKAIPKPSYTRTGYVLLSYAVIISSVVSKGVIYENDIFGRILQNFEWEYKNSYDTTEVIDKFGSAIFLDKLFHYYWYSDQKKKAIEMGRLAVNIYQEINLERFEHILRANLLELLIPHQSLGKILKEHKSLVSFFTYENHPFIRLQFEIRIGDLLIKSGDLAGGLSQIHIVENKLQNKDFISNLPDPYHKKLAELELNLQELKGKIYTYTGNYQDGINNYIESTNRFSTIYHDQLGLGRIFAQLGYTYYLTNQMDDSLKFLHKAIEIFFEMENNTDLFNTLFRKGLVVISEYDNLEPIISEMKQVLQEIDDPRKIDLIDYLNALQLFSSNDISEKYLAKSKFEKLLGQNLPFYLELNLKINLLKIDLINLTVLHSTDKQTEFFEKVDDLMKNMEYQSLYHINLELFYLKMTYYILNHELEEFFQNYEKIKIKLEKERLKYLLQSLHQFKKFCDQYIENNEKFQLSQLFSFLFSNVKITMSPGLNFESKQSSSKKLISRQEFDPLLHPDRMTIAHLLLQRGELTKLEIYEITKIPKSTIYRHLNYLIENSVVSSEIAFLSSHPVRVYSITPEGIHLIYSLKIKL